MKLSDQLIALGDPFIFFFKNPKSKEALIKLVNHMKKKGGAISREEMSHFADQLDKDKVISRQKFYRTVLKTMKETGFIVDNVYNPNTLNKRSEFLYRLARFSIPRKAPPESDGFWRIAWYVCKHWNIEVWGKLSFAEDQYNVNKR